MPPACCWLVPGTPLASPEGPLLVSHQTHSEDGLVIGIGGHQPRTRGTKCRLQGPGGVPTIAGGGGRGDSTWFLRVFNLRTMAPESSQARERKFWKEGPHGGVALREEGEWGLLFGNRQLLEWSPGE